MTGQRAADQPLAERAGPARQADVQVERHAGQRADGQRAEHPGVGLAKALPEQRQQATGRQQHGEPGPAHRGRGRRRDGRQPPGEQRRHDQHHQQQAQAVRRRHAGRLGLVPVGQHHHLAGATRHAGEECGGTVAAAAQQDEDADQPQQQGADGAGEDHAEVRQHLAHHLTGEMQADGAGDDPLPHLPAARHFAHQPAAAAHGDHRQQRADHPRQRPVGQARQPAAERTDQRRRPPGRQPLVHIRPVPRPRCRDDA